MIWPRCYAAATFVFALATAASFFWPALRAGLAAAGLLALLAATAAGSGRRVLGWLGVAGEGEGVQTLAGLTLGLGLMSLGVFALGSLRVLRPLPVSALLALLWVAGYPEWRAAWAGCRLPDGLRQRPGLAAAIAAALAAVFWTAFMPPHQYDSLVYHLALPQAYLREGRLVTLDHLVFSHFPQNGEMLFTLALALGSDLLAQMLMWLAAALSLGWLWAAGDEVPAAARGLAMLLTATHTAVMLLSATTYVEPLAMLWTTAAVVSFWRWDRAAQGTGWLLLSAAFTGLALGTKYYAGITAVLLGVALLARACAGPAGQRRRRWGELALFTAVATLVFSPWLVRNAVNIGNPFFPFFYGWFESTRAGWPAASADRYFHVLTEYGFGGPWWVALAKLPFQLLGNSLRFGGGMDVLGDMGWELSFWAAPLAGLAWRGSRLVRGLLVFCGLYLAAWFATGVVLRFLTAAAPLLCLLAAVGLHELWQRLGRGGRAMLAGGAALLVAAHVGVFLFAHAVFGTGTVLLGLEDRQEFLSRRLDYYPCARFARGRLGRNDRILIVGEQRGYYVSQPHTATTVNAPNRFVAWAEEAQSPAAYAGRLKAEGFSHVLIVPREARRLADQMGPLSARGYRNWAGLEPGQVEAVFRGPACSVFRLR